jgi:protein phosphatase
MGSAWKSDRGKVRENNEDSILADGKMGIFLLADGMGGHRGGEVASALAVQTAYELLREHVEQAAATEMPRLLAEALAAAHSAVFKKGMRDPALSGMGTTLEMLVLKGSSAFICHLGDSRAYLLQGERLWRLTRDDNYAGYLMEHEHVAEEDLPPGAKQMLTQAVGVSDELIPEIHTLDLEQGNVIILCSDGLTGMLGDGDMVKIVLKHRDDLDGAAAALVAEANARGGYDNISVVLVSAESHLSSPLGQVQLLTWRG